MPRVNKSLSFLILDAAGPARLLDSLMRDDRSLRGAYFLGDMPADSCNLVGSSVVETIEEFESYINCSNVFIVPIEENAIRRLWYERLISAGAEVSSAKSSTAVVSDSARIGLGSLVMPDVVINADARIGSNVIVNAGTIVEHDCVIGDHSHLAPGAILAGGARVGSLTTIGVNAVVCPMVSVCEGVLLGDGAVATSDIVEPGCYYGAPARKASDTLS